MPLWGSTTRLSWNSESTGNVAQWDTDVEVVFVTIEHRAVDHCD
jgi:hypothetical protein